MELDGKVALVTGASRGIGRAIALCLAKAGAGIIVNYKSNRSDCREVVAAVEKMSGRALGVRADIVREKEVERMVEKALRVFGRIDILVNNAGGSRKTKIVDMQEREWDEVVDFNLKGAFLCTKAVLPSMIAQRSGKILNVSSNYGFEPAPERAHYGAAKAGLVAFTRALALEVAPYRINVNVVAPGPTDTPRWRGKHTEAWIRRRASRIPLGRVAVPEDVAQAALFLVSDKSSYITGQALQVNGGLVMA